MARAMARDMARDMPLPWLLHSSTMALPKALMAVSYGVAIELPRNGHGADACHGTAISMSWYCEGRRQSRGNAMAASMTCNMATTWPCHCTPQTCIVVDLGLRCRLGLGQDAGLGVPSHGSRGPMALYDTPTDRLGRCLQQ